MWFKYFVVVLFVLDAVGYVYCINKPRREITAELALVQMIFSALIIWGIFSNWGKCS